jgi:iron complex outermembrane recepter protein
MKTTIDSLSAAIRASLLIGAASTLAFSVTPLMAQDDEEVASLDRMLVTGSRIKRSDVEGSMPVTVIDREQIELSGEISVAELLNSSPFNTFGSFTPRSGSAGQSFAGISLRGLGNQRTVVLIDGRRAPRSPQIGGPNDLNLVPLAAVERIEILSDGASAIYGADAIGGVINIITRRDYEGVQFRYGTSEPSRPGGKTREGHVVFGASGDRGRMLAGVSRNSRGIVFSRDRHWSSIPGSSTYSNNYGIAAYDADGNPVPTFAFHGNIANFHPDGLGCESIGGGFYDHPTDPDGPCLYDFRLLSADEAATTNRSVFLNGDFDINDDWRISAQVTHAQVSSFGRFAPTPAAIYVEADSPVNFLDEAVFLWHRFDALGPRDTFTESNNSDLSLAVDGNMGQAELTFGGRFNRNVYTERGYNFLSIPVAEKYFNDGTYDPFDPYNNSDEVLDALRATTARDGHYNQEELFGMVNMDLFNMPGGQASMVVGAEWRREDYADIYDQQSAAGNIGGSAGNSSAGDRTQTSMFFEALLPVTDQLEFNFAGRYDDYSDFSAEFSPRVALRYQPLDNLTLRASWGQGYRAPTLDILHQEPAYSADFIVHRPSCEAMGLDWPCVTQTNSYRQANPDLEAESSDQISIGMAFEPFSWLNGSLDYYNITVKNSVIFLGAGQVIGREESGLYLPDFMYSERTEDGTIIRVFTGNFNEGKIETSGLDLNLRSHFNLGQYGHLSNNLQLTHLLEYRLNGGPNLAGATTTPAGPSRPEYRASLYNNWSWGDFILGWNVNWTDSYAAEFSIVDDKLETSGKVATWISHDLQGTWHTPWRGELTVGIRNITDRDPSLNPAMDVGYDRNLYEPWGRTPYIRYTQDF